MYVCVLVTVGDSLQESRSARQNVAIQVVGFLLARDVIYTSRAYATMLVSICLFVTEVHWRIIANLGFKFRSQFTTYCGRGACGREGRDHRQEEWMDHLALC